MSKGRISVNDTTTDTPVATGGKDKGFTLIELLIVIVILGVLATVTVFAVRGISSRGEESACAADKNTLETAIESYFADSGADVLTTVSDNSSTPANEENDAAQQTLVTAEFLRSPSTKYSVSADGATLTGLGDCAPTP